jgi:hypothetical protein
MNTIIRYNNGMFTALYTLAHAGETHGDELASIAHSASPWYIAIPVFLAVTGAIGYVTWLVSGKNPRITLGIVTAVLLIVGFTMFSISPAVSSIAITVGLLLAGFQAFTSLIE